MLPKVKTSAKSVQTTRVVCTNFSRSLKRLQLKSAKRFTGVDVYFYILFIFRYLNLDFAKGILSPNKVFCWLFLFMTIFAN